MKLCLSSSVITLLYVYSCIRCFGAECTQENDETIHRCVLPLKQYAETLGSSATGESGNSRRQAQQFGVGNLLPVLQTGDVFENLCDVVARFEYCVRFAKKSCPDHVVVRLMSVSYGYLCNEGRKTFVTNANCLTKLDQIPEIKQCHETTMKSIINVNQDMSVNSNHKMSQTCRWLNYFSDCIRNKVITECGLKAWGIIFRVLKDTATTLMPNCVFSAQDYSPAATLSKDLTLISPIQSKQSKLAIADKSSSVSLPNWSIEKGERPPADGVRESNGHRKHDRKPVNSYNRRDNNNKYNNSAYLEQKNSVSVFSVVFAFVAYWSLL